MTTLLDKFTFLSNFIQMSSIMLTFNVNILLFRFDSSFFLFYFRLLHTLNSLKFKVLNLLMLHKFPYYGGYFYYTIFHGLRLKNIKRVVGKKLLYKNDLYLNSFVFLKKFYRFSNYKKKYFLLTLIQRKRNGLLRIYENFNRTYFMRFYSLIKARSYRKIEYFNTNFAYLKNYKYNSQFNAKNNKLNKSHKYDFITNIINFKANPLNNKMNMNYTEFLTFKKYKNIKKLKKKEKYTLEKKFDFLKKYSYFYRLRSKLNNTIFKKMHNSKRYKIKIKQLRIRQKYINMGSRFFKLLLLNRKIIRRVFFLKFYKQKKITKFLTRYNKLQPKYFYRTFELMLFNVLLRSHFFFFYTDVMYFLENSYVFVNGVVVTNKYKQLLIGDRIQICFNSNYYLYVRQIKIYVNNCFKKMKKKLSRFYRPRKDLYKQKSNYFPA